MRRTVDTSSTTRILGALRTSGRTDTLLVASGAVGAGAYRVTLGSNRLTLVRPDPGDSLAEGGFAGLGVGDAGLRLIALGRIGCPAGAGAGCGTTRAGLVHTAVHTGVSVSGVRAHALTGCAGVSAGYGRVHRGTALHGAGLASASGGAGIGITPVSAAPGDQRHRQRSQ